MKHLQIGEALCNMDDPSTDLIGIANGEASVFLDAGPSIARLVFVAHAGYWGGTVATADGTPRRAALLARTVVTLVSIPLSHIEEMARSDGNTWRYVAINGASHFDNLGMLLLSNVHQDNDVRILLTLRRLYHFNDGDTVFRISQSELAEMAGLSRNSANRSIRKLANDGLVKTGYGWLRIISPEAIDRTLDRANLPTWTSVEQKKAVV